MEFHIKHILNDNLHSCVTVHVLWINKYLLQYEIVPSLIINIWEIFGPIFVNWGRKEWIKFFDWIIFDSNIDDCDFFFLLSRVFYYIFRFPWNLNVIVEDFQFDFLVTCCYYVIFFFFLSTLKNWSIKEKLEVIGIFFVPWIC